MVFEVVVREIRCAVEFRADETRQSPGRLTGTLLTYEKRATDRAELFKDGALSWPENGIVLNVQHDRKQPLTRFTPVIEGREVRVDVPLPDTGAGRDIATLVRNGTMTGLSIEFRSRQESQRNGLREVRAAELLGAAVVDSPSYQGQLEVRERRRQGRLPRWL